MSTQPPAASDGELLAANQCFTEVFDVIARRNRGEMVDAFTGTRIIAAHVKAAVSEAVRDRDDLAALVVRLREHLTDINEYWNGGNGSAPDACQHSCEISEQALALVPADLADKRLVDAEAYEISKKDCELTGKQNAALESENRKMREAQKQTTLPTIVCLCGSTRFYDAFIKANYEETQAGRIVLSVGFYMHRSDTIHGETLGCTPDQKIAADKLHKRKIDLCDEVLVLNVGGYIGTSTRSEIDYAHAHGKTIRYLEAALQPSAKGGTQT